MRLGFTYPTSEVAGDPDDIRKFVRAIEALGYTHMVTPDHLVKCPMPAGSRSWRGRISNTPPK